MSERYPPRDLYINPNLIGYIDLDTGRLVEISVSDSDRSDEASLISSVEVSDSNLSSTCSSLSDFTPSPSPSPPGSPAPASSLNPTLAVELGEAPASAGEEDEEQGEGKEAIKK